MNAVSDAFSKFITSRLEELQRQCGNPIKDHLDYSKAANLIDLDKQTETMLERLLALFCSELNKKPVLKSMKDMVAIFELVQIDQQNIIKFVCHINSTVVPKYDTILAKDEYFLNTIDTSINRMVNSPALTAVAARLFLDFLKCVAICVAHLYWEIQIPKTSDLFRAALRNMADCPQKIDTILDIIQDSRIEQQDKYKPRFELKSNRDIDFSNFHLDI